jgi:hypothetical protein
MTSSYSVLPDRDRARSRPQRRPALRNGGRRAALSPLFISGPRPVQRYPLDRNILLEVVRISADAELASACKPQRKPHASCQPGLFSGHEYHFLSRAVAVFLRPATSQRTARATDRSCWRRSRKPLTPGSGASRRHRVPDCVPSSDGLCATHREDRIRVEEDRRTRGGPAHLGRALGRVARVVAKGEARANGAISATDVGGLRRCPSIA